MMECAGAGALQHTRVAGATRRPLRQTGKSPYRPDIRGGINTHDHKAVLKPTLGIHPDALTLSIRLSDMELDALPDRAILLSSRFRIGEGRVDWCSPGEGIDVYGWVTSYMYSPVCFHLSCTIYMYSPLCTHLSTSLNSFIHTSLSVLECSDFQLPSPDSHLSSS